MRNEVKSLFLNNSWYATIQDSNFLSFYQQTKLKAIPKNIKLNNN